MTLLSFKKTLCVEEPSLLSSPYRSVFGSLTPNLGAEMLRYGQSRSGVLSLAQGEGSMKTPEVITDAACKAMQEGKTFYAPILGVPEFREAISDYYARVYQVDVPAERIYATSSGTTAVHLAFSAILEPGDEVVAITPIWKNLLGALEMVQAVGVQVPLDYEATKGWTLDMSRLFSAVTEKTKALLIVTPSNPTGWTMSDFEIKTVLEFARKRGIWIIADEVYSRILMQGNGRSPSFLDHALPDDRLFVVNSFSKTWAMTGWRLGWLVGPRGSEPIIRDIVLYENMGTPAFVQYGGIAALRHGEPFLSEQLALWSSNLELLVDRFSSNGRVTLLRPDATFYAFFRVDGEPDCMSLVKRLIDEGGLSLAPGCSFGRCCAGWLRLCFAVSEQKLVEALNRFELVVPPS